MTSTTPVSTILQLMRYLSKTSKHKNMPEHASKKKPIATRCSSTSKLEIDSLKASLFPSSSLSLFWGSECERAIYRLTTFPTFRSSSKLRSLVSNLRSLPRTFDAFFEAQLSSNPGRTFDTSLEASTTPRALRPNFEAFDIPPDCIPTLVSLLLVF